MKCIRCDQTIPGYDKRQKYCSKDCYRKAVTKTRKPKSCKQCLNDFEITSKNFRNVFCSERCFHNFNTRDKIKMTCDECMRDFFVRPCEIHRKHCSKKCKYEKVKRFNHFVINKPKWDKNPRFISGITCYREIAFEKLPHCCNRCKKTDCKFEVHHIDGNRQNNSIENLEILCLSCHRIHHKSKPSVHP